MTWIIARLVALGCPPAIAKPLLAIIATLLLLGAVIVAVKLHDRRVVADHQAKIEQRAAPATNVAATERADDAIANAKTEEDMHNAVHSVPDAPSAAPSHALACERLRRRGNPPAACR